MTSGHDSQHHPNRVVIRSIAYGSQISPRIRYRRMILRVHTILRLLRACFEIFEELGDPAIYLLHPFTSATIRLNLPSTLDVVFPGMLPCLLDLLLIYVIEQ